MNRPAGLFVLLAAAACASAQVTVSTVQGGVTTPTGQIYNFGSVALGSVADAEFQLTNTGSTPVYLTSLALAGTTSQTPPYAPNFSVVCALSPDLCGAAAVQQLPILINPAGTLDFTVQFEPFQIGLPSAVMTIAAGNTITVFLSGAGVPGLTVLQGTQPLASGQTIPFGSVQVGSSQTIALLLANQTNTLLAVPAIPPPTGGDFSVAGSALQATSVPPGSSTELDVIFTPTAAGPQQATLTIGLNSYPLQGVGLAPPPAVFPVPSIQLNLATPASAQQGSLSVSLASAAASSGTGTVTLAFQSAVGGVSDDPTVAFADGTNSATFTVAQGASAGQFGANPSVSFGTGTTAGTLVFTATLGSNPPQTTNVTIPAALISIDAAVAARNVACDFALVYCTTTNVQLQINGWDNSQPRSASQIVFNFFESSGNQISPPNITFDATTEFQTYFTGPTDQGGVFGLSVLFPVIGDSDLVTEVQVQIFNSVCTLAQSTQSPSACTVPITTVTF
jgi:hypothetical protein